MTKFLTILLSISLLGCPKQVTIEDIAKGRDAILEKAIETAMQVK